MLFPVLVPALVPVMVPLLVQLEVPVKILVLLWIQVPLVFESQLRAGTGAEAALELGQGNPEESFYGFFC